VLTWLISIIALAWIGVCLAHAPVLRRAWREPVLRQPVLIFESDDWGAGPSQQADVLAALITLLQHFHDRNGRHPVVTLGVILAIADTEKLRANGGTVYQSMDLRDPRFAAVRERMQEGVRAGVFALQLHGGEHYWPPNLMHAAQSDAAVRAWLTSEGMPRTETLPSHLQSRWTDARSAPNQPLPADVTERAVKQEIPLFEACFGARPRVAVATTFVWNSAVERAWAAHGIDTVITPGRRYTQRGADGRPAGVDRQCYNGEASDDGQTYLVRDAYFEPALGHTAARLVREAQQRSRLGRPTLVEMHRFNFLGDDKAVAASLYTLEEGIAAVMKALPDVRFLTSHELAEGMRQGDQRLVTRDLRDRLIAWLRRIEQSPSFSRYAKLSGLWLPLRLAQKFSGG
jgi:hypothetical protein